MVSVGCPLDFKDCIAQHVRDIPNWPKEGVILRDLTICLSNPSCYDSVVDQFVITMRKKNIDPDAIVAIEAKGFIYGSLLAYDLQLPIIPVRKKDKLPGKTRSVEYETEYSTDVIEVDIDSLKNIKTALFVDDVLATGGTMKAVSKLLAPEVDVIYNFFVIQLNYLDGHKLPYKKYSILEIE